VNGYVSDGDRGIMATNTGAVTNMHLRAPRAFATLAIAALLFPVVAACQPAAPSAPPTTAAAAPATAVPAAKPAVAASPAASVVASPSAAAKPAASPAAAVLASPAASPAAAASPVAYQKPAAPPAPTGDQKGSPSNPVTMAFVPSADSQKVLSSGQPLAQLLQQATNLNFSVSVPTSYTPVIEAMGANQVDVGWLAPFAYVLAHDKNGSQVLLASVRQGAKSYRSQIIVRADSGITSIDQLRGKKFAFVDPASASGFLFPNAFLAGMGIDYKTFFSDAIYAGGHDKVVIAVYNKQVDAGATFGNSIDTGPPSDARTLVASTLPDVMTAIKPIAQTDPIPNDTVSVRNGLDPQLVQLIKDGLLYVQSTPDGQKVLKDLYQIDGLAPAVDKDYDSIRTAAKALNLDLEQQIAPPKPAG
jgi:phosphonate transport system substrate-binding protein